MNQGSGDRQRCETWAEHEWKTGSFIEAGRHATMGTFQKFNATCRRCGKTTIETCWLDMPMKSMPARPDSWRSE